MKLLKRGIVLLSGMSASALVLAINAGAAGFTVAHGTPVYFTKYLDTTGDIGTVEEGGVIEVPNGRGSVITGTANDVTVNSGGAVESDRANGIYVLG